MAKPDRTCQLAQRQQLRKPFRDHRLDALELVRGQAAALRNPLPKFAQVHQPDKDASRQYLAERGAGRVLALAVSQQANELCDLAVIRDAVVQASEVTGTEWRSARIAQPTPAHGHCDHRHVSRYGVRGGVVAAADEEVPDPHARRKGDPPMVHSPLGTALGEQQQTQAAICREMVPSARPPAARHTALASRTPARRRECSSTSPSREVAIACLPKVRELIAVSFIPSPG